MKIIRKMPIIAMILILGLVGCNRQKTLELNNDERIEIAPEEKVEFKIGVLVGSGGVEDHSFNQMAWEGIVEYTNRYPNVKAQMVIPDGEKLEDRLNAADELVTVGSDVIVGLGQEFDEVIDKLQSKHEEINFILLDGDLVEVKSNTAHVVFAEQEAGFIAGVAAALQSPNEKLGFIGGMDVPSVERYGLGFIAGVAYASQTYNTHAEVIDYQYQDSFNDIDGGIELATEMFDQGIDTIFVAAGATGKGVMDEAKARLERDEKVYVIGSERDQYEDGKLNNEKSVVLTSAMKHIDVILYELLDAHAQGEFPGGEVIKKNVSNEGVGIPEENKNFLNETKIKIEEVTKLISEGEIKVPEAKEDLISMIESYGYKVNKDINF